MPLFLPGRLWQRTGLICGVRAADARLAFAPVPVFRMEAAKDSVCAGHGLREIAGFPMPPNFRLFLLLAVLAALLARPARGQTVVRVVQDNIPGTGGTLSAAEAGAGLLPLPRYYQIKTLP